MDGVAGTGFIDAVRAFEWEGQATTEVVTPASPHAPTFVNEFWTSKQRHAHSLHEISYRACFKPQLPRFFIDRLTKPGDVVYDPFAGRGTTPLEAALAGRVAWANDVNPLTAVLLGPRLAPPALDEVKRRLDEMDLRHPADVPKDLEVFYHHETLLAICSLREYLMAREAAGTLDDVDRWIRMVAVNRLTGHSAGFFSVYTLPPNQATSVQAQRKINRNRAQKPPLRDVPGLIIKKSRTLLKDCGPETREALCRVAPRAVLTTGPAHHTPRLRSGSVHLVVTSPPFLDVVQYASDNWLRCWFCGIDAGSVPITFTRRLGDWQAEMGRVFLELHRLVRSGGHVAFEVGEVRGGSVRLEEAVIPCGVDAGFDLVLVLINSQQFTKTANVWGVFNNRLGTNTNRIVVFRKR
jgi:hypothetical protein